MSFIFCCKIIIMLFRLILLSLITCLIIQEVYRRYLFYKLCNSLITVTSSSVNPGTYLFDAIYYHLLDKPLTYKDGGNYYDRLSSYRFFEIADTHDSFIIKRSLFSKSSYEFDCIQLNNKIINCNGYVTRVLDCGCGTGAAAIDLVNYFGDQIQMYAMSNSQKGLNVFKQKLNKLGLTDKINLRCASFDYLPQSYPVNHFDILYFIESHGYSKNIPMLFKNCRAILKSTGILYIRTPTFDPDFPIKQAQRIIDFWRYNFSTTQQLLSQLQQAGFTKLEYTEMHAYQIWPTFEPKILPQILLFFATELPSTITDLRLIKAFFMTTRYLKFTMIKASP